MAEISIRLEGFKEALAVLDPKIVRQAGRASIDRATRSGRTVASEEIRNVWNVKKADLDPRIQIRPPRMDDMRGVISISGKGMSLSFFEAKQITASSSITRTKSGLKSKSLLVGPNKRGKDIVTGVSVKVIKGGFTVLYHNAFMAKVAAGKSGSHIGVFHRTTKKRIPIEENNVISIASMADRPEVMTRIVARVQDVWTKEFPRQLQYFLSKASK